MYREKALSENTTHRFPDFSVGQLGYRCTESIKIDILIVMKKLFLSIDALYASPAINFMGTKRIISLQSRSKPRYCLAAPCENNSSSDAHLIKALG